jgi:multisubunit Na+/H+ antiporter MnhF subunit
VNEWEIAAAGLGLLLIPCLGVCVFSEAPSALVSFQIASVLLSTILVLLSEGFHRQPFVDLALLFAFLSVVGAMVFARLMERDL